MGILSLVGMKKILDKPQLVVVVVRKKIKLGGDLLAKQ